MIAHIKLVIETTIRLIIAATIAIAALVLIITFDYKVVNPFLETVDLTTINLPDWLSLDGLIVTAVATLNLLIFYPFARIANRIFYRWWKDPLDWHNVDQPPAHLIVEEWYIVERPLEDVKQ